MIKCQIEYLLIIEVATVLPILIMIGTLGRKLVRIAEKYLNIKIRLSGEKDYDKL